MKPYSIIWNVVLFGTLIISGCKIPYDPKVKDEKTNFLVVEGYIDGTEITEFKLSRTRAISNGDTAEVHFETNAYITVEDESQNVFTLYDMGNGNYSSLQTLNINANQKYRVRILTNDGNEYVSSYVLAKASPPIETIDFKMKDGGAQIFLNTSDPLNATKYYRWQFNETWEFHSYYPTDLIYNPLFNTVERRFDQIHVCWKSDFSTKILLGSTLKLSNDIVNEAPINYIENHSVKMSVLYSILVKQYALDVEGYNYWSAMKNNTEGIGTLFDPQPNQTTGNVHNVKNISEKVVGYVGAGFTNIKRVFIPNSRLPLRWNQAPNCEIKFVIDTPDSLRQYFGNQNFIPIARSMTTTGIRGFDASTEPCVDCTYYGTNIKPYFWP